MSDTGAGKIPLVIGVTGHRDILAQDLPAYEEAIKAFFSALQTSYPNTPITLISSLAEGADRLVAKMALECGHEVIAPLPFPAEEYERDFPESVAEFRELLQKVPASNVLTLPLVEGNTSLSIRQDSASRDRQYAGVAAYLASKSHVVLALWDGKYGAKTGGTSEVVKFMLNGVPPAYDADTSLLDPIDTGPVYHVLTRRARDEEAVSKPGGARWIYPEDSGEPACETIFRHIETFNADKARRHQAAVKRARAYLLPETKALGSAATRILDIYGYADSMAIRYQRFARRMLIFILVLAGAMALAFEIYAHLVVERYVLALYPMFFLAITAAYFWHRSVGAHGKYLDYRALAEGLRVQLFWRLAGLNDSVTGSYLRKQSDELEWIRSALRTTALIPADRRNSDLGLVYERWIKDQEDYFVRCAHRQHRRVEQFERLANWLYGTGLVVSIFTIGLWDRIEHAHGLHHVLIVVMGFAPVMAALWISYADKTGLQAQSKQYKRFAVIFARARRIFDTLRAEAQISVGGDAVEELLRELGKEALIENGDWVLLHRERPIDIPKG